MDCELCGCKQQSLNRVIIDGVLMKVCNACAKFGVPAPEEKKEKAPARDKVLLKKLGETHKEIDQDMELVQDWGRLVQVAREKKGLSRGELGSKIGETTNAIAKYENEELYPPDKVAQALEHELGIIIREKIPESEVKKKGEADELTLGDIIKKQDQ
jgi:putative transcription factor